MLKKIFSLFSIALATLASQAQVKLPKLISDGMILQRDVTTRLWGWAAPGESITLKFESKIYHTNADQAGTWKIALPMHKAGGPYSMEFSARNQIILKDILFGDVYVCSGQSNMEFKMGQLTDQYPADFVKANNPRIRQFKVPQEYEFKNAKKNVSTGQWIAANAQSLLDFSAVAYYFAADIERKYHIPVGIINASVGGSPAQSWISEPALKRFPDYYSELQQFKDDNLIKTIESKNRLNSNAWSALLNQKDEGLRKNWKSNHMDFSDWQELDAAGYLPEEVFNKQNGVVWLKKEIYVSPQVAAMATKLLLGRLVDADSAFVNGKFAGTTGYQYPQRKYVLDKGILTSGQNTITIRLVSNSGRAGFVPDKPYQLISLKDTIDLTGKWKYKVGATMPPSPAQITVRWKSGGLFNAMIAPLQQFKIKGFLWYQGESNTGKSEEYLDLMKTLVGDWRTGWAQGELPFLFVQLPGYMEPKPVPSESNWAKLRDSQSKLLTVKNTAMAVAIDLGEWNDVHPLNKKDVGHRLALQAEKLIYGEHTESSGPTFYKLVLSGQQIIVNFTHAEAGLLSSGNKPVKGFAIAGKDKKYVWADALISGKQVILSNPAVSKPTYVRYAWADNPDTANLYNTFHLPAAPFEAELKP